MPFSDQDLARLKSMSHDELLRAAQTEDLAVLVESNLRLERTTTKLTKVLIFLTVVLVVLTAILVVPVIFPFFR
jgi:hypothetical protein